MDELAEVAVGETLVCSDGEDFAAPQPGPVMPSRSISSLSGASASTADSSLQALPQLSSEPQMASPFYAASRNLTSPSGLHTSGESPVPSMLPADIVGVDILVMQSAPLISRARDGAVHPLPLLNLPRERDALREALRASGRAMALRFASATTDALRLHLTTGAAVLHWSGHGEESHMAFEDGCGGTHELTPQLLASTCCAGASPLKLVFVCACHSQPAAAAFVRAGVRHVIAVRSHALVLDAAAITFTRHFYLSLCAGQSVATAFDVARAAVAAMPRRLTSNQSAAAESSKFVLLPEGGDHSNSIFDLPPGEPIDRSPALCVSNVPSLSEVFVGRQVQMHQAVQSLAASSSTVAGRRRIVVLVGAGGIGKTTIATAVSEYLRLRHAFPDGTFHVDGRGMPSVAALTFAIASALQLPMASDANERTVREELIGALSVRHALIVIDRCDALTTAEHAPEFSTLVSALLRRAPRVKLLLTCRKSVGVAEEQPLTIAIPELDVPEAKRLLQNMARVPEAHAASIAELCGCMPLALRLCGCALSSQRVPVTPDQLITRLEGETRRLRELRAFARECGDPSIEACIASSFNALPPALQLAFLAMCDAFPGTFDERAALALLEPVVGTSADDAPLCSSLDLATATAGALQLCDESTDPATLGLLTHLQERTRTSGPGTTGTGPPPPASVTGAASDEGHDGAPESGDVATLLRALVTDSMLELLPATAPSPAPAAALGAAAAASASTAAALASSSSPLPARFRLHELIRLYGLGKLDEAGATGAAAQATWRQRMVRYWQGWLQAESDLYRTEPAGALFIFDVERHNVEASLALARNVCPAEFPRLLTSGRQLLRMRFDPGSRRALLASAIEVLSSSVGAASRADGRTGLPSGSAAAAADADASGSAVEAARDGALSGESSPLGAAGVGGHASCSTGVPPAAAAAGPGLVNVETAACLHIEMGYCEGERQRRPEGAVEYARALMYAAGQAAVVSMLEASGSAQLVADALSEPLLPMPMSTGPHHALATHGEPSACLRRPDGGEPAAAGRSAGGDDVEPYVGGGLCSAPSSASGASADFEDAIQSYLLDTGAPPTAAAFFTELAAEALNLLAVNLDWQGSWRSSQLLFVHAIRVRRWLLGAPHDGVAPAYSDLANLDVASTYNNLANLLRKPHPSPGRRGGRGGRGEGGKDARAHGSMGFVEALYRRAIAIREEAQGPESPALAASLSNLSVLLVHGEPLTPEAVDEAEALLRRGLVIRRKVFGDQHCETAASYHLLANHLFYHRKELDAAERLYQKALSIRCNYYTRQSDRSGQTLFNLANLARAKGEEERAERLFVECLSIREQVCGGAHADSIKTAQKLTSLYRSQGRTEDAKRLQRSLSSWLQQHKASGDDAAWLRAAVPFPLTKAQVPEAFKLKSRLIGHKGYHLKHITQQSGAERVNLRLFGSEADEDSLPGLEVGDIMDTMIDATGEDRPAAAESAGGDAAASSASAEAPAAGNEPSAASAGEDAENAPAATLHVLASSDAALRKACALCTAHMERIRNDLSRWSHGHRRTSGGTGSTRSHPNANGERHDGADRWGGRGVGRGGQGDNARERGSASSGSGITLGDFLLTQARPKATR